MLRRCSTLLLLLLVAGLLAPPASAGEAAPWPDGVELDYQLGGARDPGRAGVVVRDRTEQPAGVYDVCYVNAFQTQPDARRFWRDRWGLVLKKQGRAVVDGAWGEWLLDVGSRDRRERLAGIVGRWIDGCAEDGYEAVELDNLDSFTRSRGRLERRDNLAYASLLVERGHAAGLAVAQKNLASYDGTRLGFDLVVAEECGRYDECETYTEHYDDAVLAVEYRDPDFRRACDAIGDDVPVVRRDRDVTPDGVRRWCR